MPHDLIWIEDKINNDTNTKVIKSNMSNIQVENLTTRDATEWKLFHYISLARIWESQSQQASEYSM